LKNFLEEIFNFKFSLIVRKGDNVAVLRIRDVYLGSRIPVPTFSIPDPGSRVDKIPDPDQYQRVSVFLTKKMYTQK
jgi:hypothetical protein